MQGFYFGGSIIDRVSLRSAILYYDFVIHYDFPFAENTG
jgi:hypothetical protein